MLHSDRYIFPFLLCLLLFWRKFLSHNGLFETCRQNLSDCCLSGIKITEGIFWLLFILVWAFTFTDIGNTALWYLYSLMNFSEMKKSHHFYHITNHVLPAKSLLLPVNRCSSISAAAAAKLLQSCPVLCDPIDDSPPGSPIPGILQPRTLEWVAISFSNAWKWKVKSESEVAQSCTTVSNPKGCSLPGSSVHGIFQARVLEWGAIAFSILYF